MRFSAPVAESTMIGTSLQPRIRRQTVSPSTSGRPRSSTTTSGDVERGLARARRSPVARCDHLVAAGLQPQAQRAQQGRVVVDDQDPRHSGLALRRSVATGRETTKRAPPPGASSYQIVLAVGLDEGLGDGEAEPRAPARVEAREAVEDLLLARSGGCPARGR